MDIPIAKITIEFIADVSIENVANELQRLADMWNIYVEAEYISAVGALTCRGRPLGSPQAMINAVGAIESDPPDPLPEVET